MGKMSFQFRPRKVLPARVKKELAIINGYKCSFPDCDQHLMLDDTSFIGQIASIESVVPHGPRYNPSTDEESLLKIENYLLLCPNHHAIIDKQPEKYTVEWLRKAREDHIKKVSSILQEPESTDIEIDNEIELSLEEAIKVWESNRNNPSEEFWQQLFQKCPAVLAQAFPKSVIQLGSKCYIGGKFINNKGGNLVDFVYTEKITGNIVLVEIKTPKTKLLGKKYRGNAYSISEELSGSSVQVLNYKDQLMKEFYSLSKPDEESEFNAFNPKCLVLAGDIESEVKNSTMLKSIDLFRNSMMGVEIIGYDELFQKAQDVLDMVK